MRILPGCAELHYDSPSTISHSRLSHRIATIRAATEGSTIFCLGISFAGTHILVLSFLTILGSQALQKRDAQAKDMNFQRDMLQHHPSHNRKERFKSSL